MSRLLKIDYPYECNNRVLQLKKREIKGKQMHSWFYRCRLTCGKEYCDNDCIFPKTCRLTGVINIQRFREELQSIKSYTIRKFTEEILCELPEYFWTTPASTSGKYHPQYALGEGGLIRHTKAAVKIAISLFELYNFDELEQDIIIASLILHDGFKCGEIGVDNTHTRFSHPLIMSKYLEEYDIYDYCECSENYDELIDTMKQIITDMALCISSHMGKWREHDGLILPKPESEMQKFVHMCDYLASRKFIEINFG